MFKIQSRPYPNSLKLPGKKSFSPVLTSKKIINGYKKHHVKTDSGNLNLFMQKKIGASRLELKLEKSYRGEVIAEGDVFKKFAIAISSAKKIHTLELDLSGPKPRREDHFPWDISLNIDHLQTNAGFETMCQSIRRLASLKSLHLDFSKSSAINDIWISSLCQTLKTLSSLKTISIDFERCAKMTDEWVSELGKALKTLSSLRNISLNISNCSQITNTGLSIFLKDFLRFSLLQVLTLNLKSCDNIGDAGLQSLGRTLKKLVSLRTVNLDLQRNTVLYHENNKKSQFNDAGVDSLSQAFKSFVSLRKMALNFSWCEEITGKAIRRLGQSLEGLDFLESLSFDFSRCDKIDDAAFYYLAESLKKVKSLKTIDMGAWCDNLEVGYYIGKGLKLIPSLQKISLSCGMDDHSLGLFLRGYKQMKSLQTLHLNLSGGSDAGFKKFSQCLGKLTKLEDLKLNVPDGVSHRWGITSLYANLQNLKKLQTISLDLGGFRNNSVTLLAENHLGLALAALSYLQTISLEFYLCKQIKKEGMQNLCLGLQNRTSLQSLSLDFTNCDFTDEIVDVLWNTLKTLPSLKAMKLKVSRNEKVFRNGVSNFCAAFKRLISLKTIDIELPYLDEEDLDCIEKTLKTLGSIETLSFSFFVSYNISRLRDKLVKNLRQGLATLPRLKSLEIMAFS